MAQTSIAPGGSIVTEIFTGPTSAAIYGKMDERQRELQQEGHIGFHRKSLGRNSPCPCGSGLKLKKCCIGRAR